MITQEGSMGRFRHMPRRRAGSTDLKISEIRELRQFSDSVHPISNSSVVSSFFSKFYQFLNSHKFKCALLQNYEIMRSVLFTALHYISKFHLHHISSSSLEKTNKIISLLCRRLHVLQQINSSSTFSSRYLHSQHPFIRTGRGQGPSKRLLPIPLLLLGVLSAKCENCDTQDGQDLSSSTTTATMTTSTCTTNDPCNAFLPEEFTCLSLASSPCPDDENTDCSSAQIKWETKELSHEYLMKQACIVAVDSVTRIITETVSAIDDYHCQYREYNSVLRDLLNDSRRSPEAAQELLTCKMIVIRSRIEELRKMIVELECYLSSVERLANAASEVAYLGHAEYSSIALSERLQSALFEAKTIKERSTELDRDMIELQALIIVESGNSLK